MHITTGVTRWVLVLALFSSNAIWAAGAPRSVRLGEKVHGVAPAGEIDQILGVFELEAPADRTLTVDLFSIEFDTHLTVLWRNGEGLFVPLVEDDDDGTASNSRVEINAERGARYRFEVRANPDSDWGGEFTLSVTEGTVEALDPKSKHDADEAHWVAAEKRAEERTRPLALAWALIGHAWLLRDGGAIAAARPLSERGLSLITSSGNPDSPLHATSLDQVATIRQDEGAFAAARPLFERALKIRERLYGPDYPVVAASINNLAGLLDKMNNPVEAKPLYERSLTIFEESLGPDHPAVAINLGNLAGVLTELGEFADARRLHERSLSIQEKKHGPDSAEVAFVLVNLGQILQRMGSLAQAKAHLDRAVAIYERAFGPDDARLAVGLNNLAGVLVSMGSYSDARTMAERALAIRVRQVGQDNPNVADHLSVLAEAQRRMSSLAEARGSLERGLKIVETTVSAESAKAATLLNSLAVVVEEAGRPEEARPLFERALALREENLGANHPYVAQSCYNLGHLLATLGERSTALELAHRAEVIGREHLRLTSRTLAEAAALDYAATRQTGLPLVLSLVERTDDPATTRRAWDALIRSRSIVLDEMAARHRALSEVGDAEVTRLSRALSVSSSRLTSLQLRGPGDRTREQYRGLLDEARRDMERASQELAMKSLAFRDERTRGRAGLNEVAAGLPPGGALVAYYVFPRLRAVGLNARHSPDPGGKGVAVFDPLTDRRSMPFAKEPTVPSYVAFLLRDGKSDFIPLGPAEAIDVLVARWQEEAARGLFHASRSPTEAEAAYRAAGTTLRRRIWDPIAERLGGVKTVFVVPDGMINVVSFASLPSEGSSYLIEGATLIHYLSAERDLVSLEAGRRQGHGLLAVGDPAFDESHVYASLTSAPRETGGSVAAADLSSRPFRGDRPGCTDFTSTRFRSLPASKAEVDTAAELWRKQPGGTAVVLTGAAASEAAIKEAAPGKRILHLSTHGFFLEGRCPSALQSTRGIGGMAVATEPAPPGATRENPLVLSGLVLAGANHRDKAGTDEEDGILTAQEVAALDLGRVDWAVLSACDTGVGALAVGEGVLGLRRAFQIAGARTLIMSLWSVEDVAASEWMTKLYSARLRGLSTAEAVRHASVQMIAERRRAGRSDHPFFWAPFVAAGGWE